MELLLAFALATPVLARTSPPVAAEKRGATVIELPAAAARAANLRRFDELLDGMLRSGGDARLLSEFREQAARAMARFPIPLLGPGLLRTHRDLPDGAWKIATLLRIFIEADHHLRAGNRLNTADAIVRAFSTILGMTVDQARFRILQASYDCEFFSPELVLMIEALRYG